jgi:hypothetical protein
MDLFEHPMPGQAHGDIHAGAPGKRDHGGFCFVIERRHRYHELAEMPDWRAGLHRGRRRAAMRFSGEEASSL